MQISKASLTLLQTIFGSKAQNATIETYNGAYYYSVGMMRAGLSRANANVERVYALVFDDVGTKVDRDMVDMMMPPPTYVIESSPKNFQYGWAIDLGCTVDAFSRLRDGAAHRYGAREARAPSNLVRLPEGVNGKPGITWDVALVVMNERLRYDYAVLLDACGTGAPARAPSMGPQRAPSLEALRKLLASMPNDKGYDYDHWINVGIAIYGASGGEEWGRASWILWSEQQPAGDYTAAEKWETFGGTNSAGWGALEIMAKARGVWGSAAEAFDDGVIEEEEAAAAAAANRKDQKSMYGVEDTKVTPRRPWVYGKRLIQGFASTTVAAGGVGKSSLLMVEALAMATGKDLLKVGMDRMPRKPLTVWVWNGEDPRIEMDIRMHAICKHYGVNAGDLKGTLYFDSGRDSPIKLAVPRKGGGVDINEALVADLIATIRRRKVDVLMVDPLVSAHYVDENNNMQMDAVIKTLGMIAGTCGIAIDIVHHSRKQPSNGGGEASVDDARGASAVINAARYARVLTPMPRDVGAKHGIMNYRSYFSVSRDAVKANLTPALDADVWYRIVSVDMENGDPFPADGGPPIESESVGVVEKWHMTAPKAAMPDSIAKAHRLMTGKVWRHNWQTGSDWVGVPVGEALGVDVLDGKTNRIMVEKVIADWIKEGWLNTRKDKDATRHVVTFVEVGKAPPESAF